jgi:DNA-binding PadR family transcriptional regulator
MQPRLLLQLSKKPAYGYELMGILAEEDDHSAPDPGHPLSHLTPA